MNEKNYLQWYEDMGINEDKLIEFNNSSFDEKKDGEANDFWEEIINE